MLRRITLLIFKFHNKQVMMIKINKSIYLKVRVIRDLANMKSNLIKFILKL